MKTSRTLLGIACCMMLASCSTIKDKTYCVTYQSVRMKYAQPTPENPIPEEAKIAVGYTISPDGKLTALVYNRTDEIMTIDQTLSFFVNSDGKSTSYYDPTVRTTSTTDLSSSTKGASVNLGAIAGAFGIGGALGQIANGINVGGSGTSGQSVTEATYVSDQPRVSLAPRSNAAMSKVFDVAGLASPAEDNREIALPQLTQQESPCRFSVCITYSFDGGETFDKLVTDFYVESYINVPLKSEGMVNDALKTVTHSKPDLYSTPWWRIWFRDRYERDEWGDQIRKKNKAMMTPNNNNAISNGIIYDYQ